MGGPPLLQCTAPDLLYLARDLWPWGKPMRRSTKRPNLLFVLGACSFSLLTSFAVADSALPDMAARTELISINTLTVSDAQFLTGDTNGKATTTTGQLRIARGSDRLPVVVLQHGSGGMGANIEMWSREFNAMGVSTFALDGFTGRGLTQVSTNQALLGRLNFILDIYRAAQQHLAVLFLSFGSTGDIGQ
jgi:hypothetical protein